MLRALLSTSIPVLLWILISCSSPAVKDNETLRIHQASVSWLDSINWVDRANDTIQSLTYGNGQSGHLVFLLNSFLLTHDSTYLEKAKVIGAKLQEYLQQLDSVQVRPSDFTLYNSIAGSIFALVELSKVTGEGAFTAAAIRGLDHVMANQDSAGSWGNGNDILFGDAGAGLLLLYAHENLGEDRFLNHAQSVGNLLLSRAIESEAGLNWTRKQGDEYYLPNFSHGTAGIGYFLAKLFEASGDSVFLLGASKAYDFIEKESAADSIMLLPYGVPDLGWSNPYDIGWAHGPAGVARFCYVMYERTQEGRYLEGLRKCYAAIELSGIPNNPDSLFGYDEFPIDYRFGMAGVADFLLDYERIADDPSVGGLADSVCTALVKRASVENGQASWPFSPYEFMRTEDTTVAYTGYFYGSSGILVPLMKREILKNGERFINYIDNPF